MSTDLARIETPFELPDNNIVAERLRAVAAFQKLVHATLVRDLDYGVIPGTQKPTLLKPGAEKIVKLLGLADTYSVEKIEDWDKPLFAYTVTCRLLFQGEIVSEGLGSANSYEGKYRWRQAQRVCPTCGKDTILRSKFADGGWYCFDKRGGCGAKFADNDRNITEQVVGRVENDDIFSQVNTLLKMAKKRALVDAALSAGRLSDLFTQDMEDTPSPEAPTPLRNTPPVKTAAPATSRPTPPQAAAAQAPPKAVRVFANRGQLMEAAEAELGIGLKGVLEVLVISRVEDIGDLGAAWARLKQSRDVGPDSPVKAAAKP